jgi:hypothetical protein
MARVAAFSVAASNQGRIWPVCQDTVDSAAGASSGSVISKR